MVLFTDPAGQTCSRAVMNGRTAVSRWQRRPLFQTTSSALFQSGYHTPLLVLDNTNLLEEEKHNSLPPFFLLVHVSGVSRRLPCTLPHTYHLIHMKNVRGRPPGCSMPGQRKIFPSSSMRHSVPAALGPTHISPLLDRHVLGRLQGSACCSAH